MAESSAADGAPLTDILVRFGLETRYEDIPDNVRTVAKQLFLDTLGVTLACSNRPIGKIITRRVKETSGSPKSATVIGGGIKVAPHLAALANGTMANALDFDGGFHHPTIVQPTALAVAEAHKKAGRDVLAAFIVGMEIAGKLQQSIDGAREQKRGPTQRGWWHVKLTGPLAAAATAARLLGLKREQAARAVGIASHGSGGFRRNMGTMAKSFHSGCAARDGIEAAELAAMGFTGDEAILESRLGFFEAICQPGEKDAAAIAEQLGKPYVMARSIGIKDFPACSPAHPLIDAALALRALPGVTLDAVRSIEADLYPFSLLRHNPTDEESAGFSGAYVLATTLVHGALTLDQITDKAVHEPKVRALMAKTKHVPSTPGATKPVILRLADGSERRVDISTHTRRVTDQSEIEKKFMDCAMRVLSKRSAEEICDRVMELERQPSVTKIMSLAAGKARAKSKAAAKPKRKAKRAATKRRARR
jgi:2-methylcitrate dehydratase PrpD